MNYYRLKQSLSDCYCISDKSKLPRDGSGYPLSFWLGQEVAFHNENPLEITLKGLNNRPPRHFIEGGHFLVVSQLFVDVLEKAGVDNYQLFPVIVLDDKSERKWNNYFIFNEIGLVDVLLLEECKYTVIDEGNEKMPPLLGLHRVVFSEKKLRKDYKMFQLVQSPGTHLYVSEEVMDVLKQMSPPEKWGIDFEVPLVK
jgi:hypothetical protein